MDNAKRELLEQDLRTREELLVKAKDRLAKAKELAKASPNAELYKEMLDAKHLVACLEFEINKLKDQLK